MHTCNFRVHPFIWWVGLGHSHPFEKKIHSQTTSFALILQRCPWFWVGPKLLLLLHDFGFCNCCDNVTHLSCLFVGPPSQRDSDYCIQSNFWKFYLIWTDFTLGELVSLVKVFRLSKLEQMFFGVQTVDTVGRCTTSYLLVGPACLWRPCCQHVEGREINSSKQKLLLPNYIAPKKRKAFEMK